MAGELLDDLVAELVLRESGIRVQPAQHPALRSAVARALPNGDAAALLALVANAVDGPRAIATLIDETKSAGAWVFNGGLFPPDTATVVRPGDDDLLVTDGPYLEGKEHIGGLLVVEAPELDAALEWGRRTANATGLPIEVRPFQDEDGH